MADSKIGAAFVEVTSRGLAKVHSDLDKVREKVTAAGRPVNLNVAVDVKSTSFGKSLANAFAEAGSAASAAMAKLSEAVNQIGPVARKSFIVGTAAITGFVRAADPVGFMRMQGTLAALSVQIGSIFLPILDAVSKALEALLEWFRGLSDEQKDSVSKWAAIALGTAAVLAVLPKLAGAFGLVSTAIRGLGAALTLSSGGLFLLLGAVAAALSLLPALFGAAKGGGGLGGAFAGAGEALSGLVDTVAGVFGKVAETVRGVVEQLRPLFLGLVATVGQILGQLAPAFGQLVSLIGAILEKLVPIFTSIFGAVLQVVGKLLTAVSKALEPILGLVSQVIDAVGKFVLPLLDTIGKVIDEVVKSFLPLVDTVTGSLVPIIGNVVGIFTELIEGLSPVFDGVRELINVLIEALTPAFQTIVAVLSVVTQIVSLLFGMLIDALKGTVSFILNILQPVFQGLSDAISILIKGLKMVINGVIDLINGILKWYNSKKWLPGKVDLLKRLGEDEGEKKPEEKKPEEKKPDEKKPEKKETGRHAPMAEQKIDLLGLVDAWKRAQQANVQTPEQKAEEERRRLQKKGNDELEKHTELLEEIKNKKGGMGA